MADKRPDNIRHGSPWRMCRLSGIDPLEPSPRAKRSARPEKADRARLRRGWIRWVRGRVCRERLNLREDGIYRVANQATEITQ